MLKDKSKQDAVQLVRNQVHLNSRNAASCNQAPTTEMQVALNVSQFARFAKVADFVISSSVRTQASVKVENIGGIRQGTVCFAMSEHF